MVTYQLNQNGSWNLVSDYFHIQHIFPYVNSRPLLPLQVHIADDSVTYVAGEGTLTCTFYQTGEQLEIETKLDGFMGVHDICPIGGGEIIFPEAFSLPDDSLKVFAQGFGMEGPSGIFPVTSSTTQSNGLLALILENHQLFFYATDHTRFIHRYFISRKENLFSFSSIEISGGFNLECAGSEKEVLPKICIFDAAHLSLSEGLTRCAGQIAKAMHARTDKGPAYHWCSWYYHYQLLSQEALENYLPEFARTDPDLNYIQIDAGYCPSLGDWLKPNHLFPEGLKKAAQTIMDAGFTPGIWIAPFIVGDRSLLYKEHPDWVLKDIDGKPFIQLRSYNEPKAWGNPDCNYFVLDASHPEALAYLRQVFETLYSWGYRLFKTDFMFWTMHDTSAVSRYNPSRTSVEILRDTLQVIREAIGEESYHLGCIAPFLPFIGYADGMRIAGDVGAQWEGAYGPVNLLREITADNYFQNIYWQNDPDSVLLRDFDIFLNTDEIRSLALLQALSGGIVTTSDPLHLISEERKRLWRFLKPDGKHRPSLPDFGKDTPELVLTHQLKHGNLLFILNPADHPLTVGYGFQALFGEETWYVHRMFSSISEESKAQSSFFTCLKPHESILLFLTKEPLAKEPENIWMLDEQETGGAAFDAGRIL